MIITAPKSAPIHFSNFNYPAAIATFVSLPSFVMSFPNASHLNSSRSKVRSNSPNVPFHRHYRAVNRRG